MIWFNFLTFIMFLIAHGSSQRINQASCNGANGQVTNGISGQRPFNNRSPGANNGMNANGMGFGTSPNRVGQNGRPINGMNRIQNNRNMMNGGGGGLGQTNNVNGNSGGRGSIGNMGLNRGATGSLGGQGAGSQMTRAQNGQGSIGTRNPTSGSNWSNMGAGNKFSGMGMPNQGSGQLGLGSGSNMGNSMSGTNKGVRGIMNQNGLNQNGAQGMTSGSASTSRTGQRIG